MAFHRKFDEKTRGPLECPSQCGYTTDRRSSLSGHVKICKKVLESPLSTTQASDSRMSKRVRGEETTLVGAFPIEKWELAKFKAEVGGAPWTATTLQAIAQGYGHQDAPKEIATSVDALNGFIKVLGDRSSLKDRTRGNYSNILKNSVLARIWKYKFSGTGVDAVKAALKVISQEAARQATKSALALKANTTLTTLTYVSK